MNMSSKIKNTIKQPTQHREVTKLPPFKATPLMLAEGTMVDWGITTMGVDQLWKVTKGEGVRILIIDTGMPEHQDVTCNLIPELCFDATGEGKEDRNGHSTFVSSILCGCAEGNGVSGYAPKAKFFTARALDGKGMGDINWTTKCLQYAVDNSDKFDLINMSLGAPVAVAKQHLLIKELTKRGKIIFCAAGNFQKGRTNDTIAWPAAYPEVIAVAAYDENGYLAPFSSWGKEVDFAFPGVNNIGCWINGGYVEMSGTSFACPAACGLGALVLARYRARGEGVKLSSMQQMKEYFCRFTKDMGAIGPDNKWGNGIIDVAKMFEQDLK